MFELTKVEFNNLRSQIVTSSWGRARYLPMAFSEHGVLMLSSVLNSEGAIQANIQIMRTFTKLREALLDNKDLRKELEELKVGVSKPIPDPCLLKRSENSEPSGLR